MTEYVQSGGIQVAKELYDFINDQAIPGTGIGAQDFWAKFDKIANELAPKNRTLLAKRDDLQAVMNLVRGADLGQPFQFNNFRD